MDKVDLKRFLTMHTTIPGKFIDEYLNMNIYDASQTDHVVDLDIACRWLNVRKGELSSTIRHSYKINVDYIISKAPNPNRTKYGNNYKRVLLTPDCFKTLCMLSRSKNAAEVRKYFIQLEALIFKYHKQFMNGITQDVVKLEAALKPKRKEDHAGYVYVLSASHVNTSVFKIGRTKDFFKRLSTYQTGKLEDVKVVYRFRTDKLKSMEGCVKHALKERQYRKYKELYEADLEMIREVIETCGKMEGIKSKYTNMVKKQAVQQGGYYLALIKDS
jgi:phage anti-repressor protein